MTEENTRTEENTHTEGNTLAEGNLMSPERIGVLAVRALLYEVSATPKPGLVDRENNGAHKDMTFETFLDSAAALKDCFTDCARAGAAGLDCTGSGRRPWQPEPAAARKSASRLRSIGLAGEASMLRATGGVNTHKGLIFSLGILCAAAGGLWARGVAADRDALQQECSRVAQILLGEEGGEGGESREGREGGKSSLSHGRNHKGQDKTHGELVYEKTGIRGARGEALSGFDSAFHTGAPALKAALVQGYSVNQAMVWALLSLMACGDDTNLVYRGGLEGLAFVKAQSSALVSQGEGPSEEWLAQVRQLDKQCIEKNLSPGGSADLLAISVMVHFLLDKR